MHPMERYRGCLLGLAIGDALGTTLEFQRPGSFTPIEDVIGGGPFMLAPGEWTDDTSMALCLADSLIACQGFDRADQLGRYLRWYRQGYLSSTGRCFDIGDTVRTALERFERTGEAVAKLLRAARVGNGSLMRLAPVPLFYARSPREALEKAGESSRTTHNAPEAVDACRYLAALLVGAVQGVGKEALLADHFTPLPGIWGETPLTPEIAAIAAGSFTWRNPPDIRSSGYVVAALEAALWAFYHSTSFREGALLAVNLGEDADTTGAIYGQVAGAFYGERGIPERWRLRIAHRLLILSLAETLYELAHATRSEKRNRQHE